MDIKKMQNDIVDMKVMLSRMTATMEGVQEMLKRSDQRHDKSDEMHIEHRECCNENKLEVNSIKSTARAATWMAGTVGIGGIISFIKSIIN